MAVSLHHAIRLLAVLAAERVAPTAYQQLVTATPVLGRLACRDATTSLPPDHSIAHETPQETQRLALIARYVDVYTSPNELATRWYANRRAHRFFDLPAVYWTNGLERYEQRCDGAWRGGYEFNVTPFFFIGYSDKTQRRMIGDVCARASAWYNNDAVHRANDRPAIDVRSRDDDVPSTRYHPYAIIQWWRDGLRHRDAGLPAYVAGYYVDGVFQTPVTERWFVNGVERTSYDVPDPLEPPELEDASSYRGAG